MVEQLHYYCSSKTFFSILQKQEVWLTALALSNDALEGTWALRQYLRLFKREDRARQAGAEYAINEALRTRVALGKCFSAKLDLLSQWRGYADNGRGVCLTFQVESLREAIAAAEEDIPGLMLKEVCYEGIESRELPKLLYDTFRQAIEGCELSEEDGMAHVSWSGQPEKFTEAVAALFEHKNPAFIEEAEWRLFVVQTPSKLRRLDFREAGGLLSPYIRLPLPLSAIHSVRLGPQHPTPPNVIEDMMRRFECKVEIQRSNASYRSA